MQDDLLVKYGIEDQSLGHDAESVQRLAEGQNLEIRRFLHKYESVIEGQRQKIQQRRQAILTGETPCSSELERLVSLRTIDDLWADYLATITDLREGVQWLSWGGRDPLHEYLTSVHSLFTQLEEQLDGGDRQARGGSGGVRAGPLPARRHLDLPDHRSAVWDRDRANYARVGAKIQK